VNIYSKLKAKSLLGLNRRNAEYILRYNNRCDYPKVDNKVITKRLARAFGIPTPPLYFLIETPGQIRKFEQEIEPYQDFVIKPARGSGGEGILVITGLKANRYRRVNGSSITIQDLQSHLHNVLSGLYSLGGIPDTAIIERRVLFDEVFNDITFSGVPDIRIIVFFGVPVMAMLRLPTSMSQGKANLHQGAAAAGVRIVSGKTFHASWLGEDILEHPDTGEIITGRQIPHWEKLLDYSARAYELSKLPYLGADFVIDKEQGPLLLELNARPGLQIQIANQCGLEARLETVRKRKFVSATPAERVSFAKENFSTTN
jgi:alpha-L-glutamate ligase-like protein